MSVNYATQYCAALSQQYPNVLHFGALYARNQEGDYKWTSAHTIEVPTITVTGRVDGSRTGLITEQQRHSNTWTPLTLRNHRAWQDFIHPRDIDETNQVLSIANITRVMNEQEKFPEKDKYLISTVYADWLATGRVPMSGAVNAQNVLEYFDQMMTNMTEHNVPAYGRICYVTPQIDTIIKNAQGIYRNLSIQGNAPAQIQRAIENIDNVQFEVVPSECMLTAYDFTVGAKCGASAKQVHMFLVHPTCVITPENYDFAQLDPPSAGSQGKWQYFEESMEDVFLLPNKQFGAEFLVGGLTAEAATFTSVAGAKTGTTKLTVTAPSGAALKEGTRYFYATAASTAPDALTYGQYAAGSDDWTEWDGISDITATNGHKMTLLVCDVDSRVYASGNATVASAT